MNPVNWTVPINWNHGLNKGLLCWWLNVPHQRGGSVWHDLCRRHNGILNNMPPSTWVNNTHPGGEGGSLDFAGGSSDFVDVGTFFVVGNQITLSCWVHLDSVPAARDDRFISKADGVSTNQHDFMLGYQRSGGDDNFRCRINRSTQTTFSLVAVTSLAGEWVHVLAVKEASGTVNIYVNGIVDTNVAQDHGSGDFANNSNSVYIGNQPTSTTSAPDGQIDDVRIWSRALRPAEIHAYYIESRAGHPRTLNRRLRTVVTGLVAGANPKGPLGMPLHGPLAGPIA